MPKASRRVQRDVRVLVDLRDGHSCRRCGRTLWGEDGEGYSRHHRIPRGAGGSALVERASIIVKVCGSGTTDCHGWIESHRTDAEVLGWLLPKLNPDIDPEAEPLFTIDGWVLLDDTGEVTPCAAPRRDVP